MAKPWVLAALGLSSFAVLVWSAGPLLLLGGEAPLASPQARALVIAVFTLQYLAQKLWSARQARRTNSRVVSVLEPAPQAGLTAEAAQLRERFASALAQLRRARFAAKGWRFGRAWLYQLPWYVIIGAPGAGKTTALLNSGLSFPLAATLGRGAVRGVGGTRNCDWWFTDRAVLIDTAGRYTTHESDRAADRGAWEVFLGLLRRARPRRPLNGVLVAVSMSDLLGFAASGGIAEHARVLRERLDELESALQQRLPVYVLLTKCDLLPGFVDWYAAFDRRQRDQVWGVTFQLRDTDSAEAATNFAAAFDRLVNQLADGLIERLEVERDPLRRSRIFALPRQLRACAEPLAALVRGAFGSSGGGAAAAAPRLRGVYLTSGTQQGTPIDRMLSAFGRELGLEQQILPPNQSTGKSFFLSQLLGDVVFAEADLGGRRPLRGRWPRRVRLACIALLQLGTVALGTWWVSSYARTVQYMARLDDEVSAAAAVVAAMPIRTDADPRPLLPALDAVRSLTRRGAPMPRSMPLLDIGGSARAKLSAGARAAYGRLLLGPLQARIAQALDAAMRTGADPNLQYEALKAYVMFIDAGHFSAAGLKLFVMADWDSLSPPMSPSVRRSLETHLDALLEAGAVGSGVRLEPALVEAVRSRLGAHSAGQLIALRLAVRLESHPYADFTVASIAPAAAGLFVAADGRSEPHAVPGRYTLEAYRAVVLSEVPVLAAQLASEAPWVLGASLEGGAAAAAAQLMGAYRGGYARAWADLLDDLHLKAAASNQEATRQAQALAAADGPLALVLTAIVGQTSPKLPNGSEGPIAPADPLAGRFASLAKLLTRDAEGASPLDALLQSFRTLQALRTQVAAGTTSVPAARERLAHIVGYARGEPEPVRSMVLALAVLPPAVEPSVASAAALSREIAARLGVACLRSIAGRFPFDRSAAREASLEDFSRMFAPRGAFDAVFGQLLASRVDTSSDTWRPRITGAGPSGEELERFRSAARIRDVFFAGGGSQPAVQLTFRPLDMDQDIERLQLEIDGQTVRYAHGPPVPTVVRWPGPNPGTARIEVTPASSRAALDYSGPWALFRLFDRAAIQEMDSPGHLRIVFDFGGRHASFEVESASGANPFRLRELERFDCPIPAG